MAAELGRALAPRALALFGPSARVADLGATLTRLGYAVTTDLSHADVAIGIGINPDFLYAVGDGTPGLAVIDDAASVSPAKSSSSAWWRDRENDLNHRGTETQRKKLPLCVSVSLWLVSSSNEIHVQIAG